MDSLTTATLKSKNISEVPPNTPLERGEISPEGSKGNPSNRLSTAATDPPSRALDGGSGPAFKEARAKRLRDAPARFRQLYRRAWKGKSRKAAIRVFCLECACWSPTEVSKCTAPACPLYEYRLGG